MLGSTRGHGSFIVSPSPFHRHCQQGRPGAADTCSESTDDDISEEMSKLVWGNWRRHPPLPESIATPFVVPLDLQGKTVSQKLWPCHQKYLGENYLDFIDTHGAESLALSWSECFTEHNILTEALKPKYKVNYFATALQPMKGKNWWATVRAPPQGLLLEALGGSTAPSAEKPWSDMLEIDPITMCFFSGLGRKNETREKAETHLKQIVYSWDGSIQLRRQCLLS